MKQIRWFSLYPMLVCLSMLAFPPGVMSKTVPPVFAATEPSWGNGTHFCGVVDCQPQLDRDSKQPNNRHYARTFAANLNVGEPRTVRLIYFLPNDRPYREDVVQRMKDEIRTVQTFYAEQMQAHGYGEVTFRIETDPQGEPMVHRVDGQHPNSHYLDNTVRTVPDEIERIFSLDANIYLIVIDNGGAGIITGDGTIVSGIGIQSGKNGGYALVADTFGGLEWVLTAHELGHAFGLNHDFRSRAYIMSYGHLNQSQLSPCHAEFLSVHPYFNPEIPIEVGEPPTIKLISPRTYPAGSESVSVQLNVSDSEGLHQVFLWAGSVWGCRRLAGEEDTIVEFDYDGQWGTDPDFVSTITRLSDRDEHLIVVLAVDTDGNVTEASFVLEVEDRSEQLRLPTLVKISGVNQQGPTNAPLAQPFVVEARDQYGNLLPNVLVTFAVIAGEGRLSGRFSVEQAMTDAKGRTRRTLTLGPHPGTNIILVRAPRLQGCEPVHFNARGVGVPPVSIMEGDYRTWHLPDDAIRRLGKGSFGNSDRGVAFSPDSQRLAVASGIGVWFYDVATSREIALLPTARQVYSVSFSPDGTMLASGSDDGTIQLWNTSTGADIATLSGHPLRVYSVSFSPDGRTLASGDWTETVKLWDVTTGHNVATLTEAKDGLLRQISLAFSPDGRLLASGFPDGTVKLWNVATRTQITVLFAHMLQVLSVSFSPDGATLASSSDDGTVKLWDVATSKNIASLKHRNWVDSVSFSPDGRTLASGSRDGTVRLWNVTTKENIATFFGHVNDVTSVSFSPDGTTLASMSADETVKLWDLATGDVITLYGHTNVGTSVVFAPNGTTVATGTNDETVRLWDVEVGRNIDSFGLHTGGVEFVSFSSDGTTLASIGGWSIKLWNVATGKEITTLFNTRPSNCMSFSPDGTTLAVGDAWGLLLWERTGIYIATPLGNPPWVHSVAFSPDGATLASGSEDGTIQLWEASTLTHIATVKGHTSWVDSVAFSPDGRILASGSSDFTVKLWEASTLTHITTLKEHTSWVKSVAFSPDGTLLASGSYDRTVRLWNVATKANIATFEGHAGQVGSVFFSPDGATLVSGSEDGTALFWDTSPYITPPEFLAWDVNGDGSVNVLDLVVIAASFGQSGQHDADVNGDGVVSIVDLVLVAGMFDTAAAAPSAQRQAAPETLTAVEVERWLTDARALEFRDPIMKRGFLVLEQLLVSLTPRETQLLANYPNPFNPETWIPYQLAEDAFVTLTIYDQEGRVVRTLDVGQKAAGGYENRAKAIHWDGRNEFGETVASGVYFYHLTAGDYSATRRMVILK